MIRDSGTTRSSDACAPFSAGRAIDPKAFAAPTTIAIPIMPPTDESSIASMANCIRTCREEAPHAFRMPISFVRSRTATNMTFIMPIPATKRLTAAISITTNAAAPVILPKRASIISDVTMEKSLSSSGRRLLNLRIVVTTSSSALPIMPGSASTLIFMCHISHRQCLTAAVIGTIAT